MTSPTQAEISALIADLRQEHAVACKECGETDTSAIKTAASRAADLLEVLAKEIALMEERAEKLNEVYEAARGLCCGVDWNKGNHAIRYRTKLITAVRAMNE